jgi:coenzyme F420-reducing hydrogenase alpha subunit
VHALARVEGEGGLTIRVQDGKVHDVALRIFEPPRFFEALLRGRDAREAPDITSRICGICPVAYQMSCVHAIEKIYGIVLPPPLRALRRLLYCGEWIESHALHIYMLHAPDFLGFDGAVAMAQSSAALADVVRRGLRIKKAGNSIVNVVGGREVHPINVRVGGFYKAPSRDQLDSLVPELTWARDAALETVRWAAGLPFPEFEHDYDFICLRHDDEYPMNEGRLVSSSGLDIAQEQYIDFFEEYQVEHSNALHSRRRNRSPGTFFVGPLARWNLTADRAPLLAQEVAANCGVSFPSRNPFVSIVARSLELVVAFDESLRLIDEYEMPSEPGVSVNPCAGVGEAITEAPRGILYHRYETDASGLIRSVTIIPPTSQNQPQIEDDLVRVAPALLEMPEGDAALHAERVVRNYDPCISCATHFLKLKIERQ